MVSYRGSRVLLSVGGQVLAKAASAEIEIDSGLKLYYEAGDRKPASLIERNELVRGTLSRLWIDVNFMSFIQDDNGTLPEFNLTMTVIGGPILYVYNCKLENLKVSADAEGWVKEDVSFTGLDWNFG